MALVLEHAEQLVCVARQGERRLTGAAMRQPAIIPDGAVVIEGERIVWAGPTVELPTLPMDANCLDVRGKVVLPGFIDSHTHLLFAGTREDEFEQRLLGKSYQEIAAGGGGIESTVRKVRASTREQLTELARHRLGRMLQFGVTTVEVKSGYGLSLEDELKCLQAIAELQKEGPLEIVPTFLGAHTVPSEYRHDRAGYLRLVREVMLHEVAKQGLAEFCDVFCESGVFSVAESEELLQAARKLGYSLKLHADELTMLGGAELAGRVGAASADHLLCISDAGIDALAASSTVATLLPGTALFLGLNYAPARKLIERGVAVALASDCNPGTCPTENLPLVGTLACTQMGMLPGEALVALTLHAAAALGRADRLGSLEAGKQADLIVCDVPDYRQLFYHFGVSHVRHVVKRGKLVWSA